MMMAKLEEMTRQEEQDRQMEVGGELTPVGQMRFEEAEKTVHKFIVEFGRAAVALYNIHRFRWYRAKGHKTFAEYMKAEYGWSRQHGYRLMAVAQYGAMLAGEDAWSHFLTADGQLDAEEELAEMSPIGVISEGNFVLTEGLLRPLVGMDLTFLPDVWRLALAIADGERLTYVHVAQARVHYEEDEAKLAVRVEPEEAEPVAAGSTPVSLDEFVDEGATEQEPEPEYEPPPRQIEIEHTHRTTTTEKTVVRLQNGTRLNPASALKAALDGRALMIRPVTWAGEQRALKVMKNPERGGEPMFYQDGEDGRPIEIMEAFRASDLLEFEVVDAEMLAAEPDDPLLYRR